VPQTASLRSPTCSPPRHRIVSKGADGFLLLHLSVAVAAPTHSPRWARRQFKVTVAKVNIDGRIMSIAMAQIATERGRPSLCGWVPLSSGILTKGWPRGGRDFQMSPPASLRRSRSLAPFNGRSGVQTCRSRRSDGGQSTLSVSAC
jgi:hypothetical protein